ncbi:MAG TPA: EAL domain-containing protein [Rhodocyclaceae bacterium]|nr:EAL domain-containing protein [Rhodocyclaceae bacterium]
MSTSQQETILLVDDSPDMIDVLGEILRPDFRVKFALNGPDALALAQRDPPSLILLDVLMPGMDGYEVCRRLKDEASTRSIPVIFLTGSGDARDEQKGLEAGAVDYLRKPPNPPLVLRRVRLHLALRNQSLALEARVEERTRQLEQEISERERAEIALRESEEKFRAISASAQDGIVMMDNDGLVAYWNAAAEQIFGYTADEVLGRELHPLLAPERFLEAYRQGFSRFRINGEGPAVGKTIELVALRKGGGEFPIELSMSAVRLDQGIFAVGIVRDISGRKQAEASLHRLNHALRTISRCNEVLVHATEETRLLQDMCRTIVEVGEHRMAWVGYAEHDGRKSVRVVARFGKEDGFLDLAQITWSDEPRGRGPTGTAIRTGTVQANQDFATNPHLAPWREEALKRGYAASIALPLMDESGTFGALTIYAGVANAFDDQEIALLAELASDLAYGIGALRIRAERDRALKDLQLAAKVFEESKEGILITDPDRNILAANRSFTAITGYSEAEVIGLNPRFLKSDRHDPSFYDDMWASINQTGQWMGEIWNRRKDGELFPALQSISAVRNGQGVVTHYLGILADITHRKESEERIRYLTQHDALTGLANRSLLVDRLDQAIIHARRSDRRVAAILLDVDRLKVINDSLGHGAGDQILLAIGQRLQERIRPGDTLARVAGDEFMVVLADVASENDVSTWARRLLGAVAAPMPIDGQEVVVTASLGVALFPKDGESAEILLKNADAAMYRVKELGRNSVQFYAPEMNARMLQRLELESGLRRALERQEFVLHYQPKVELMHGQVVGAEALIRWRHPSLGMVSPADFISLAEESGLIIPIGEWVIEAACRQLRAWQLAGLSDLKMSVNLSARQFQQDDLVEVLTRVLRENELQAQYLEVEVTESAVMQDPERTIAILGRLKSLGLRISLDDFGTGYSSLSYLKAFPIDTLKIDQSFVRDITEDPEDMAIAFAVISLAHSLKHYVIAEGVETESQLNVLRRHRCDQVQGYFFSRPLPAEEFAQLVLSGKTLAVDKSPGMDIERTLLVVDDEENILSSLRRLLRRDGYRILVANSAAAAFEMLALNDVQVILSDQRMPQMSGTEFLSRVKEMYPDTIRLVLSGYTELQSIADAINHGAIYKFLTKPWEDELLREHIRDAFLFYESKRDKARGAAPKEMPVQGV